MHKLLFALILAPLAACQIIREPGVTLASTPPGARINVDGRDSGFVTPCAIELSRDDHKIEFALDGYRKEERNITSGGRIYTILWHEMYLNSATWRFPMWLNYVDGLTPVKIERGTSPARIFVRLQRAQGD